MNKSYDGSYSTSLLMRNLWLYRQRVSLIDNPSVEATSNIIE